MFVSTKPSITLLFLIFFMPILTASAQPPIADHHVHIRSEDGTAALLRILEEVQGQEQVSVKPSTGAKEVITRLDSSGTQQAVLLSTAYFFAMPDVEFENEQERVRRENIYVAQQAELYPDRLIPFCSVNPLSDYAISEIRWCGESGRFAGLKLHFANSDTDLRNREHTIKLKDVFQTAGDYGLAMIAHTWTRHPDFGAEDVRILITEVLPEAGESVVQIAHLGGPGTYSKVTAEISEVFLDAIERSDSAMDNVYFDIAEVPHHPGRAENEEQREAMQKANRNLFEIIAELGAERVLWGTDWIAGPVDVYLSELEPELLSDEVWEKMRNNKAPYIEK
jgi:predicted TIM-barrel fold metal-dependent hydrolase